MKVYELLAALGKFPKDGEVIISYLEDTKDDCAPVELCPIDYISDAPDDGVIINVSKQAS